MKQTDQIEVSIKGGDCLVYVLQVVRLSKQVLGETFACHVSLAKIYV